MKWPHAGGRLCQPALLAANFAVMRCQPALLNVQVHICPAGHVTPAVTAVSMPSAPWCGVCLRSFLGRLKVAPFEAQDAEWHVHDLRAWHLHIRSWLLGMPGDLLGDVQRLGQLVDHGKSAT